MKRVTILSMLMLGTIIPYYVHASNITTQPTKLYPYQSVFEYQNDFIQSTAAPDFSIFNGSVTNPGPVVNRPGIIRRSTSAVINTNAGMSIGNGGESFDPSDSYSMIWITRLNTTDVNTTTRFGALDSPALNPPVDGLYWEKLDADTNWFCVSRAGGVETRVDTGVAITAVFATFAFSKNSSGITFSINNTPVCGTITTNVTGSPVRIAAQIINSAAAAKTVDYDYVQVRITRISR